MILNKKQMRLGDQEVISHFEFSPPLIASADLKSEACFIFPVNSVGRSYRADGGRMVGPSEGILMKCGPYVNKWSAVQQDQPAEVVIIRLLPEILEQLLDKDIRSELNKSLHAAAPAKTAEVVALNALLEKYLQSLFFYFDNPQLVSDELVLLKIKELCLLLIKVPQSNAIKQLLSSLFEPTRFSLLEIVDANYQEDLSVSELATLSNMSPATYQRKFKQLIGESPSQYIRNKRLAQAQENLRHTKRTISEIAFDCGFNDPNYFTKVFTRKFGLSPSQFRQQERSD